MIKGVRATALKEGDVLALPSGRTATVEGQPRIGTQFVSFATEYGKTRVGKYDEVLLEVPEEQ